MMQQPLNVRGTVGEHSEVNETITNINYTLCISGNMTHIKVEGLAAQLLWVLKFKGQSASSVLRRWMTEGRAYIMHHSYKYYPQWDLESQQTT